MRTTTIPLCMSLILLAGCSGLILREDDSGLETTGKVVARVLLCPVTVCLSELEISEIEQREIRDRKERDYLRWLNSLSPERRAEELALEQARTQAAGMALFGLGLSGGPFRLPTSPPAVQPSRSVPPISCTSNRAGQSVYTNCY